MRTTINFLIYDSDKDCYVEKTLTSLGSSETGVTLACERIEPSDFNSLTLEETVNLKDHGNSRIRGEFSLMDQLFEKGYQLRQKLDCDYILLGDYQDQAKDAYCLSRPRANILKGTMTFSFGNKRLND